MKHKRRMTVNKTNVMDAVEWRLFVLCRNAAKMSVVIINVLYTGNDDFQP